MQKTCKKHGGKRQLKLSWQDNWKTKFRLPQGKARVPSPRPCPNPHQDLQLPFPTGGGFRSSINPNQHSPGCHTPAGPIVRASGKFNTRTGHMSFRVSREPRTNQNTERRPAAGGPSTQLATAHPEIIHPMLRSPALEYVRLPPVQDQRQPHGRTKKCGQPRRLTAENTKRNCQPPDRQKN